MNVLIELSDEILEKVQQRADEDKRSRKSMLEKIIEESFQ